jgi:hypothetical protein
VTPNSCHSERSEESLSRKAETLHFVQGDTQQLSF